MTEEVNFRVLVDISDGAGSPVKDSRSKPGKVEKILIIHAHSLSGIEQGIARKRVNLKLRSGKRRIILKWSVSMEVRAMICRS
jgi:hypothetical protein